MNIKIYNEAKIKNDFIEIDGEKYNIVKGKHCIWIPDIETKLILSFHGGIEPNAWRRGSSEEFIDNFSFNDENKGWSEDAINSIKTEVAILFEMAKHKMSPKPREIIFIKNVISKIFTSDFHCDCQGWYGYVVDDASKLSPGEYSFEKFNKLFLEPGLIQASQGAIGDLAKKEGNLVNKYIVDVRRSLFDMMKISKDFSIFSEINIPLKQNIDELKSKCRKYGQFPFQERSENYQSYWLNGDWIKGTRDVLHRFERMQLPFNLKGKSVLDLGCQMGSIAMEAWRRGARKVTGIDNQFEFIDCARDIARANGFYVNFQVMDLTKVDQCLKYIKSYYREGVDILFCLSLYKHIKEALFDLIKNIDFKTAYIESHNVGSEELKCQHVQEMVNLMNKMNLKYTHIGFTEDRSKRVLWKINK